MKKQRLIWLSFWCLLMAIKGFSQPVLPIIHKGNRPPIDINQVPETAFTPGKIHLKLLPKYRNNCHQLANNNAGNILFNIPSVDSLNKIYQVNKVNYLFKDIVSHEDAKIPKSTKELIEPDAVTKTLKEETLVKKHQSWGFDLWVEIILPPSTNIKKALLAYQQTNAFEVVEPVYKASIIGNKQTISGNPPTPFTPNDPVLSLQWNLHNTGQYGGTPSKDIDMLDAWGITTGDTNVIVSVHDNAIGIDHPDLAQNIAKGKSFNFIDNNDTLTLNEGHGSHCAGIIAGVSNNGIGISGIAGGNGTINSGARLMSCEIFGPNNTFGGFPQSIVYAADNGAAISNNSWGYDIPDVYEIEDLDAIDYFIANGGGNVLKGGIVVCASGNDSVEHRIYPGGYDQTMCVAATNNQDKKAYYSNFGKWVDINAPGGEGFWGGGIFSTDNTSYSSISGTSFACPHVAGVAALVASLVKGKASASDVREIVLSTTDNNYPLNPNYPSLLGTGRLNAYSAVLKAQSLVNNASPISSFTATSNCNNITLSWNNTAGGNVIIAVNNTSEFGALVDGNTYNVGDALIGGGAVIYSGNGGSFSLPIVDSISEYDFKIWGVVNNNRYTFSKTIAAFIKPTITAVGDSALVQDFNLPPLFPTKTWHGTDTSYDNSSWIHTANDTVSENTGAGDAYSMCLYNYQYNTVLGAVDTLSGPMLHVKGADSIVLTYWHAYNFINKGLPYSDSLEVVVSADCGKTFTSVWKKGGKDLATIPDTAYQNFYPIRGLNQWKKDTINLSSFRNADNILIGFRGYNGKGNNLFLDNIKVAVHYKTDVAVAKIIQPDVSECDASIIPQIMLENVGINTITTCNIGYQIDGGGISTAHFSGSLKKDDSVMLNLPTQGLQPGTHSIKVFTYSPNNTTDNNTLNDTLMSTITVLPTYSLPYSESFENINYPTTSLRWQLESPDNFDWRQTDTTASNGKTSMFAQNFRNYNLGDKNDLLTPPIDIYYPVDSIFLLFDVAAAMDTSVKPPYDTLQVDMTKDCGITWTTIYKKWGPILQTAPPNDSEFIPTSNQWRTDSLNLGNKIGRGDLIRFRFRDINNNGNDIYLDNVRFYSKLNLLQEKGFLIYPNPFKNYINIQHYSQPTNLRSIIVYNSIGQRVSTINYNGNANSNETINLSNLPSGLYVIQLIYTDKKVVDKMVKLN